MSGLINWLVTLYGWRLAYMLLGGVLLLIMAPAAWLFYRDRPELYRLHPDGRQMAIVETEMAVAEERSATARSAFVRAFFQGFRMRPQT